MSGNRKEHKYEHAVLTLLSSRSLEQCAKKLNINVSTLRRWMAEEGFQSLYSECRQKNLDYAVAQLQSLAIEAVNTLRANLEAEQAHVQVRAAATILDIAFKGTELMDFAKRLEDLETVSIGKVR